MKKILCPTDFSDTAQNAIAYAAKLAQVTGSKLVLFNVQSIYELSPKGNDYEKHMTLQVTGEQLEEQAIEISRTFNISCYPSVQATNSSLEKTIAGKSLGYDLIVMGTNGPDDIYDFFMGSNAYRASVKSAVPVLLIPEGCTYNEVDNIVYAFDYLRERKLPMEQLKPVVRTLKSELTVLQIMEEAYSPEVEEELKELQFISQQLYAEDLKLNFETIRSYEIAESVHSFMLREQPDMLALCSAHKSLLVRLFHNSLIKHISTVASYPVLVFHQ